MGLTLLDALVETSEAAGYWTLQTAIFPENERSIAIHSRAGFRIVGTRERLGSRYGRWRDVVLMERRSDRVAPERSDSDLDPVVDQPHSLDLPDETQESVT